MTKERGLGWVTSSHGLLTIDLNDGSVLNYRRYDAQSQESPFLCDIKRFDIGEYLMTELGTANPEPFPEKFDLAMLNYETKDGEVVKHDPLARLQMHDMQKEAEFEMSKKRSISKSSFDVQDVVIEIVKEMDLDDLGRLASDVTGADVKWDSDSDEFIIKTTENYNNAFGEI